MASEAIWEYSGYAEWSDGQRRLTGPGIVFFDDDGRVLSVGGPPPGEAATLAEEESAATQPPAKQTEGEVSVTPAQETLTQSTATTGG